MSTTTATTSSSSPRYYAELHANINAISLAVQMPPKGIACTLTPNRVDLIPSLVPQESAQLRTPSTDVVSTQVLRLPCAIAPTKTTLDPSSANSSILSLKLTVDSTKNSSVSTALPTPAMSATAPAELPPPPIPAAELQGLSDLGCGVCGSTLMLSNRTKNDPIDQLQCLSLTEDAKEKSKTVELVEEEADASREQVQKVSQEESSVRKPAGNDTRRIQRIVDLPSEHWQELVECWMCHDEEDIKELREGDLGAREGQVLVGATYLLIHALDIDQDALQVHPDAKKIDWTKGIKRRWRPLVCSCCLHSVGEGWYHARSEETLDIELLQVKLHKYSVRYIGQDPKDSRRPWSIPRQRFVPYLLAEIFESMRHHATYRFILEDRLTGKDLMLLWVLNWDAAIMTNQKPDIDSRLTWFGSIGADIEELQQMNGPRKVVKVLYLPAVSDIKNEESTCESELQGTTSTKRKEEEVWKRWRADQGAEHVRILPTMALGVRLLLEQSSSLLPPNQSKVAMDNMRVGWLLL